MRIKYCHKLHGFVFMYLKQAEDDEEIVQKVFIKISEARGKIEVYASFESFLFTIAYNATLSLLSKRVSENKSREYLNSPACGEIDIFEQINSENINHGTAHWADSAGKHTSKGNRIAIDVTQWNNYSITWSPKIIKWFVNDVQFHEVDRSDGINNTDAFHNPHFILVNLPIGGSWPGSPDEHYSNSCYDGLRLYQSV